MDKGSHKGLQTLLGPGTVIEGTITAPHSIRVEGTVKGRIETTENLTVGQNSVIEADVKAKSAIIGGTIRGNIIVEDRVELESKAVLHGDIQTRELVINEGAMFHGRSTMDRSDAARV